MNVQRKVLIVGAGPTGLTLANDLARRGVAFDIVDRKAGPTSDSKGLALNISSQYGLKLIGVRTPVGERGMSISRLNLHWQNARYSSVNFAHVRGAIQSLVTQPQAVTENELISALLHVDARVKWCHRVTNITDTASGVSVEIESPAGELQTQQYDYVVGCDGKHSVVRKHLDIAFDGFDYDMHFTLGDFDIDFPFDDHEVQYFVYPDTFFILVPIANGRWRVVVKFSGAVPDEPPSVEDMNAVLARYFGKRFKLGAPAWISRAPFYNRVAQKIHKNRCFLAGDAAHLFSPIGGTGMNTGMQDAFNLGWKLAAVITGQSDAQLLDTYQLERLPAIQEAAASSDTSTQLICKPDNTSRLIQLMAPRFVNRTFLNKVLPSAHSGLAMRLTLDAVNATNTGVDVNEQNVFAAEGKLNPVVLHAANKLTLSEGGVFPLAGPVFIVNQCALSNPQLRLRVQALFSALKGISGAQVWFVSGGKKESDEAAVVQLPTNMPQRFLRLPDFLEADTPSSEWVQAVRPDGITLTVRKLSDVKAIGEQVISGLKIKNISNQTKQVAMYE